MRKPKINKNLIEKAMSDVFTTLDKNNITAIDNMPDRILQHLRTF